MPTSSSDSEGTSERPRRRPSTRKAKSTRGPSTRTRRTTTGESEVAVSLSSDDDFGSGVENEERADRSARGRRSRSSDADAPAEDTPDVERSPKSPSSSPRRGSRIGRSASAEGDKSAAEERPERGERTSSRFERKIADVEPQTGMRYFSTEELDFGDDDHDAPPRAASPPRESENPRRSDPPRARSRYRSDADRVPVADRDLAGDREYSRDRDPDDARDYGDEIPRDDMGGGDEGDLNERPRTGESLDEDRRPRRRRRRRRRSDGDAPPRSDAPGRTDGPGRVDPNRFPTGGRVEGGRGRSDGGGRGRRGGGGRNDGGRGRRNESSSSRGGRDSGRGRDHGPPRRGRTIQPSTEIIEGTFDGVLELHPRGYGFLRDPKRNYAAEDSNPFVSSSLVEKYKLRPGVLVRGDVGQGTRNQGPRLREVETIDGFTPEEYLDVRHFDNLTAINPFEQIKLEVGPRPLTMRVMDLLCPVGKGQRALLVAPPRTGKTMLLQDIANSVSINHPEIHLMVLLIDERPEEVTEMRRNVKGEVISSSLDSDVESHIRLSELIIERAKRLAEEGKDVFILLDSITRLARAFNKASSTGRTGTGGLDIRALDVPKKLFGQARRFDEGGSLTVCGTALIDTGGRMDEAIFQEFKGTGNMEMVLSRELADRRIWPSIDITKSGTRREEKILAPDLLEGITMLRRSLISLSPVEAMEQLTKTLERFPTNKEFLSRIKAVL